MIREVAKAVKGSAQKRPYRSDLRRRQAEATRAAILDAVRDLLGDGGIVSLTVRAVARRAGVAPETVYAAFGSKAGLLAALGRRNLAEAVRATTGRGLLRELVESPSLEEQLTLLARISPQIMGRNWPVLEAMRQAADSDSELAELYAGASKGRRVWMRRLASGWRQRGMLRRGQSFDTTVDALWALTSPEMYRLLVVERGWSDARYGRWLADAVAATALAPPPAGS